MYIYTSICAREAGVADRRVCWIHESQDKGSLPGGARSIHKLILQHRRPCSTRKKSGTGILYLTLTIDPRRSL